MKKLLYSECIFLMGLGWGDRRGAHGTFPYPSRDGGEGGEEAVHMPTGVAYVTKKHFFLVRGTLTHLALCIIRGGAIVSIKRRVSFFLSFCSWVSKTQPNH